MSSQQKFLLLQGPASPFFKKLGLELIKMGHLAWKVNFCGGDKITSLGGVPQFDYQDKFDNFSDWLTKLFKQYTFTHIILFGDTRPFHTIAINIAKQYNCNVYVYEEGYLRPDWITLEKCGVNGNSNIINLYKDFNWLLNHKPSLLNHPIAKATNLSTTKRFLQDLIYRFATFCYSYNYPHYKTYRPTNAFIEYLGWFKRIPIKTIKIPQETLKLKSLIRNKQSYYFYPLQLNSDSQIRIHSKFGNIENTLKYILQSFFKNSPKTSLLIIKNHPFDTGLINYKKIILSLCKDYKVDANRVIYFENGHLPTLLKNASGTVVINSTVGLSALVHQCPTITLGTAIYNIPGLTNQCNLDFFWNNLEKPNIDLYIKLEKFLMENNQINGNFYTKKGISMSIEGSLKLLHLTYCLPLVDYVNTLLTSPAKL